jgi:hypothetical protein
MLQKMLQKRCKHAADHAADHAANMLQQTCSISGVSLSKLRITAVGRRARPFPKRKLLEEIPIKY